jgi:hypothetical protein
MRYRAPTTFGTSVDVGQGNMVPGIAVDQYAATFARWLGVSDTDVPLVLPNVALRHLALPRVPLVARNRGPRRTICGVG